MIDNCERVSSCMVLLFRFVLIAELFLESSAGRAAAFLDSTVLLFSLVIRPPRVCEHDLHSTSGN